MIRTRIRVVRCTIVGAGGTFLGVPGRSPASWPKTPVQHFFLQVIHHFRSGSVSHNNNQQLIFLFLVDAVFPKRLRFSVSEETTTTFFATSYQTELTTLSRVQFQSKLIVKVSLIRLCSKNLSQQSLEISLRRSVVSLPGQRAGH